MHVANDIEANLISKLWSQTIRLQDNLRKNKR